MHKSDGESDFEYPVGFMFMSSDFRLAKKSQREISFNLIKCNVNASECRIASFCFLMNARSQADFIYFCSFRKLYRHLM